MLDSDESDDEPLSVLAAKKLNPATILNEGECEEDTKIGLIKNIALKTKLNRNSSATPIVVQRPLDVWLYLKDFNTTGPFSCLLCPDWFINRPKVILHYVLNHKKDFCGICRYFVPDRQSWIEHEKFHVPWPCSQCVSSFQSEDLLRDHLRSEHNLVHCRLCHFRVSADTNYDAHLLQKHNVTNGSSVYGTLWELDPDDAIFSCVLCSKTENLLTAFFSHYMGYHHFTLKCLASLVSGKDPPFTVKGVDISSQFLDSELSGQTRFGYVDLEAPMPQQNDEVEDTQIQLSDLVPEIKTEAHSDDEDIKVLEEASKGENQSESLNESQNEESIDYRGEIDFDITLTEILLLDNAYFDYISKVYKNIDEGVVPDFSSVDYGCKSDFTDLECKLCKVIFEDAPTFTVHMTKMHSVKTEQLYSCRVCLASFDTNYALIAHTLQELGDFEDLWICQFCDKEFNNRELTRQHLTDHWDQLEFENCFSPHLGFKCRLCPMLFWNEQDRELHQINSHFEKYKESFYKCEDCSLIFGDKVWFVYHYIQKHINEQTRATYLLKCCLCCLVISNIEDMRNHFEEYHPEAKKLYCSLDTCVYRPLSQKKSLKVHVKTVHSTNRDQKPKVFSCHVCQRRFPNSRSCNTHITAAHGTAGKFKCKLCKDLLQTADERKLHYLLRHPGRHPFECSECGKSFQYKSSLYMHKQDHQPNKQSYTCDYCGKIFAKKDSFREHVQIHEGPRHACSYCPMRFVQRSNMLRHERRHTGERPYTCPHCPKTFADKGACTSHSRTHSKDRSYVCLYCGQTFLQKSKLTYHIRRHTGENLETCTVCSKLFTSACSLREHMKTHAAKNTKVKCLVCDKKYHDERYMLRHMRTIHGNRQLTCPLCPKLVSSMAALRYHVLTHSSLNTFKCKCCKKSYMVRRTIVKHLRKRHGLNAAEVNIKEYYSKLEPRECNLKIDETTMTRIFGPPKKDSPNVVGDFVTFTKRLKLAENLDQNTDDTEEADQMSEDDKEPEKETETPKEKPHFTQVVCKEEVVDPEYDLEPTDFVSVKIEPVEEEPQENN
ncbi:zinc finger protein 33A-like [Pieris napi]|uniref:C2H2-type domain-containing protein n=1 Tax=Pieris macdunnoughi TaxID=345717 RepID=A0A821WZ90_9NEOP|nr:zinc finger protein 33A-like [Pieris napi]CAF4933274.1 unnamed protein product [Pieris macdunnoughi]